MSDEATAIPAEAAAVPPLIPKLPANRPPLAKLLRQRRRKLGYSQREAAAKLGVTPAYVGHLERGDRFDPGPELLRALEQAYGLSPERVLKLVMRWRLAKLALSHPLPKPETASQIESSL